MSKEVSVADKAIRVKISTLYLWDPSLAQEYIDKARDWAIKTDGMVTDDDGNEEGYSSKAWAIGGTGTETNNSKYYASLAGNYASEVQNVYNQVLVLLGDLGDIGKILDEINGEEAADASVTYTFDKTLTSASQLVIRNSSRDDYCYSWLLKFEDNYVLPVGVSKDGSTVDFDASLMQQIDTTAKYADSLNGSCYVGGVLTPVYGRDAQDLMEYLTIDSKNADNMSYPLAANLNWDEGHLVNNHCSVTTSRFAFTIADGVFTATDTYNNNKLVAKYGYKVAATTTEAES